MKKELIVLVYGLIVAIIIGIGVTPLFSLTGLATYYKGTEVISGFNKVTMIVSSVTFLVGALFLAGYLIDHRVVKLWRIANRKEEEG